jgi:hypothetical protein
VQSVGPYLEDATPIELAARLADLVGGFQPPKGYASRVRDAVTVDPAPRRSTYV